MLRSRLYLVLVFNNFGSTIRFLEVFDCAYVRPTVCDPYPDNCNAISNRFENVERLGSVLVRFFWVPIDHFGIKRAFVSRIFMVFVTDFVVP